MPTIDDPLFEPWSATGPEPAEPDRTPPVTGAPVEGQAARAEPMEPARLRASPTEPGTGRPARPSTTRWARTERTPRAVARPKRESAESSTSAPLEAVSATLYRLADRLELARHRALVDDRSDRSPPSLRFRIEPWRGPLDPLPEPAPVLEIAAVGTSGLVARVWSSPLAVEPSSSEPVAPSGPDGVPLDEILFRFVDRALNAR